MASTLRAHGPPPAIRALVDSGSHMCDPYGARALVSASHHANTERLEPIREPKRDTHHFKPKRDTHPKREKSETGHPLFQEKSEK